jgi:hypothetical protein
MQFIRLPQLIEIEEWELPELVVVWMNIRRVQNIKTSFIQMSYVKMLISSVIQWFTRCMPN